MPDILPREALRATIRKRHQTLQDSGGRTPVTAFGEFSKLVFIKEGQALGLAILCIFIGGNTRCGNCRGGSKSQYG